MTLNAAEKAHACKILKEQAKIAMECRTIDPWEILGILKQAEALEAPRKKPAMDRLVGRILTWRPKAGPAEWLARQRALDVDHRPDATVIPFRRTVYTGHGDGHTYRQDIRLSR